VSEFLRGGASGPLPLSSSISVPLVCCYLFFLSLCLFCSLFRHVRRRVPLSFLPNPISRQQRRVCPQMTPPFFLSDDYGVVYDAGALFPFLSGIAFRQGPLVNRCFLVFKVADVCFEYTCPSLWNRDHSLCSFRVSPPCGNPSFCDGLPAPSFSFNGLLHLCPLFFFSSFPYPRFLTRLSFVLFSPGRRTTFRRDRFCSAGRWGEWRCVPFPS